MIVLMKLLDKTDNHVIYSYGYDEDNLDGKIKVNFKDPNNYEVLNECTDKRVGKRGTLIAACRIIKAISNNNLKDLMSFES